MSGSTGGLVVAALGRLAGTAEAQQLGRLAERNRPVLHTHDPVGRRIDEVEFHPSYHALLGRALHHGLHGTPWAAADVATDAAGDVAAADAAKEHAHVERAASFMLFSEAEPSVLCPVSMSYAVMPALRANAALHAAWGPKLAATAYDARCLPMPQKSSVTIGMGMTEKQGGSDVRANTTRAQADGTDAWGARFRLTGHKWFFSAPMCDAFLVLAQTSAGISCFFMPRWLPDFVHDGARNAIRIQRLKHKLGNQANASSEVEFDGATAWLVGEAGRGVAQILAMGALTRLDCALGTAGLMRQALSIALHHTAQRQAFGKALLDRRQQRPHRLFALDTGGTFKGEFGLEALHLGRDLLVETVQLLLNRRDDAGPVGVGLLDHRRSLLWHETFRPSGWRSVAVRAEGRSRVVMGSGARLVCFACRLSTISGKILRIR